jgi:uncharacterized protein
MSNPEKLVIMATHGPEDPELATIPFVMGCAALASDVDAVIGFQAEAVRLVSKGEAERVEAAEFPALVDLIEAYRELGGKLLACAPSLNCRHITDEDLVEGAEIVAAGRFVAEITSSTSTLVY